MIALCEFFSLHLLRFLLNSAKFLSAGGGGGTRTVPSSGLSLKLLQEETKNMNLEWMERKLISRVLKVISLLVAKWLLEINLDILEPAIYMQVILNDEFILWEKSTW